MIYDNIYISILLMRLFLFWSQWELMFSTIMNWFRKTKKEEKIIEDKKRKKPIWTIEVKNPIIDSIEKDNYRKQLKERKIDSIEERRRIKEARKRTLAVCIAKNERKKEEEYMLNARYNIMDMMTQHCKIKCFERWIKIEELQKIFYLSDNYQYDVCRRHKNYRIIMDKYVMHIWYNWFIITIYYDDKEERDRRAIEYAKNSFDWKQVLFYPINKKIVWDSINKFVKKD